MPDLLHAIRTFHMRSAERSWVVMRRGIDWKESTRLNASHFQPVLIYFLYIKLQAYSHAKLNGMRVGLQGKFQPV
ncbi:hypothetical protein AOLI_G00208680 [Acnodon oligacanthus]